MQTATHHLVVLQSSSHRSSSESHICSSLESCSVSRTHRGLHGFEHHSIASGSRWHLRPNRTIGLSQRQIFAHCFPSRGGGRLRDTDVVRGCSHGVAPAHGPQHSAHHVHGAGRGPSRDPSRFRRIASHQRQTCGASAIQTPTVRWRPALASKRR